ncbi:MAG: hypothetical protein CMF51_03470 [Legionellales bacterium]|nr:hypothetical protein [Legionellales bacterium]|tara:strand:+ start:1303 stop:2109 length:807 start_codon:yes stop_codon:yes gene_type:complete
MSNLTDLQRIKQSVKTFNVLRSSSIDVEIVLNFFRSNHDVFHRTGLFRVQCEFIFLSGDERQACEYLIGHDAVFNTFIEQLQMTCRFFEDVNIINELSNIDGDLDLDQRIEDYSNGDAAQDDVIVVQAEEIDQSDLLSPKNIGRLCCLSFIFMFTVFLMYSFDFLPPLITIIDTDYFFLILMLSYVTACTLFVALYEAYDYFKASTIPVLHSTSDLGRNPTVVQAHLVESNDPVPDPIIVHSAGDLGSNLTVFQAHLVEDNDMSTNDR